MILDRASRQPTTDLHESPVPVPIVEREEAEQMRAKEEKDKRERKEKKKQEEKEKSIRAKGKKLTEEKQSPAYKRKTKEMKDSKRKTKDKKHKEPNATERSVSPRPAPPPIQQLSAARKDRAKPAISIRESMRFVEHGVEQQQAIPRSLRFLAVNPIPPAKKSGKPPATPPSVVSKTALVRPLGLSSGPVAPRIGKAATALSVHVAHRLSPAEE